MGTWGYQAVRLVFLARLRLGVVGIRSMAFAIRGAIIAARVELHLFPPLVPRTSVVPGASA
jgi:phage tail tape-measure protein